MFQQTLFLNKTKSVLPIQTPQRTPPALEVPILKFLLQDHPSTTWATPATTYHTGVTDPKEVQGMMQAAQDALERSHRSNLATPDNLMTPLQKYVNQGDLAHQLAIKTEECNKLHLMLKHQWDELSINDTHQIQCVQNYTYLGVTLDPELNFEKAAREVIKKVNHKLYLLSFIRKNYPWGKTKIRYTKMYVPSNPFLSQHYRIVWFQIYSASLHRRTLMITYTIYQYGLVYLILVILPSIFPFWLWLMY